MQQGKEQPAPAKLSILAQAAELTMFNYLLMFQKQFEETYKKAPEFLLINPKDVAILNNELHKMGKGFTYSIPTIPTFLVNQYEPKFVTS